ncbi:SDR family NAD(P)-dependent oxidoreductase [Sphingomonas immobilis]|uniref:SDR family oxidoreductase n=1 Tax=Sphingomonas immobilis TaxID=3063997 RepID=A0ABT8ZVJ5_9SPHN|nr:SDR family oxidoreductase [Sphingomonas sp. CA1-15]MDO7841602.1 SDR family oxidoreductase [Sphingomonas sp. CA1-15]
MTTQSCLITGASAGLGALFAEEIAKSGQDVILVARRMDRLQDLAARLSAAHNVTATPIVSNLAAPGACTTLIAEIARRGLSVDTLINNAGFGARGAFADSEVATQAGMIDLNCRALVELTHAVLPGMVKLRHGAILNVASTAGFQPGPGMAVYYATKAFVLSFSEALHEELRGSGIAVSALCPGPTRTEFAEVAGMGGSETFDRLAADPAKVVRDGLAALKRNRAIKVSGVMNAVMAGTVGFAPRGLVRRISARVQKSLAG